MGHNKKITLLTIGILLIFPIVSGINITENEIFNTKNCKEEKVNLLRLEHYLEIVSEKNVDEFNVRYAFPPDYSYQTPILMKVFNDSTEDIINYKIENDTKKPNKFVNFKIQNIKKDQSKLIHFTVWVLAENNSFEDMPDYKEFPEKKDLPNETKIWLTETDVTQKNNIFIKLKAKQMRFFKSDMISYTDYVSKYIKNHRYLLFILQLNLGLFFSQDAVTTLFINGENVGRSHLACALFRNQNIPSRVILANNDQGFWTQMHYMVEYYVPDYGWVLLDTTKGKTAYPTGRQVINRICYPEDENNTKTDYIFPLMKGEERWIWINNPNIKPYYVDCREASKSQMLTEKKIKICDTIIDQIFNFTSKTFNLYQKYLGKNLTGDNKIHFEKGIFYQKIAIENFLDENILDYYCNIKRAEEEYQKIKN